MTPNLSSALSALETAAERLRLIEAQAREALFAQNDPATYRQKLEEKTMLLMELPELIEPFCDGLGRQALRELRAGVDSFALRAERAMELSSLFFMNCLLYPEDYKEGEPNDLEVFIERLRARHSSGHRKEAE